MNLVEWKKVLQEFVSDSHRGRLSPIEQVTINQFEVARSLRLPTSYRAFCQVFGAGSFGRAIDIAVPGYAKPDSMYSLQYLDELVQDSDPEEYSPDPDQHKRGLFFGHNDLDGYHMFDPEEVTDSESNEYAVYSVNLDFHKVVRTGDTFWDFITNYCLGSETGQLGYSTPPNRVFFPARPTR